MQDRKVVQDTYKRYKGITSIICKVLESVIRDHIITHFVRNDIFSKQQYGFLKGRKVKVHITAATPNIPKTV